MTLQANVDPSSNISLPLFGLGALFASRRARQPSWTYEPPSLRTKEPPDPGMRTPVGHEHRRDLWSIAPDAVPSFHYSPTSPEPSAQTVLPSTIPTQPSRRSRAAHGDGEIWLEGSAQHGINTQDQPHHDSLPNSVVPETIESSPADVTTRFEKFRLLVDGTSPDTHDALSDNFLVMTYLLCCPASSGAARFCLMVLRYLLETPWRERCIAQLISQPSVQLPDALSSDGLEILQLLEEHFLAPSLTPSRTVHLVYQRLAEQVQNVSNLPSRPASSRPESDEGHTVDYDLNLRLLIRGFWESALLNPEHVASAHVPEKNRLHAAGSTRLSLSPSSVSLLRKTSRRLSTPDLARRLRKIWLVLGTDASKAPQQLGNLMTACINDHSKIPMALDLLETIPQTVLCNWIAAMSAGKGNQAVPQLGQMSPLYLKTWFELFYRLDARNHTTMSDPTSLCQFAFERFASACFHHDYPSFTLVTALLYALLGHRSFAGSASNRLIDYIESGTLISARRDYRGTSLNDLLAELMYDLDNRSLPNHGVLELLAPYIHEHQNFQAITNLLKRLNSNKTKLSDTSFLVGYTSKVFEEISGETDISRLGYNIACFSRFLTAQVALNITTAEARARLETLQSRRFFSHILDRAKDARIVPLVYRDITPDLPHEAQGDVIHQFAHQYAIDRTRSIKQNWRSIHYLYIYLRKHRLPIQPLFTKALVSVCITRPLAENRFVPQKRAVSICRLVATVEGEAAATQVEHYFWAWRGDLILAAKRELVRLGVYDIARVGIVDRLKLLRAAPERRRESLEKGYEPDRGSSVDEQDTHR